MKTMNFTKKSIESIEPPAKGFIDVKDSQRQYLRIRVTSTGNRTFYLVRKFQGKPHYKALGRHPDITIGEAREACDKANTRLISGESEDTPAKLLFGELFFNYLEGHAKRFKRTWKEDQRLHEKMFSHWDNKPVVDITRKSVIDLHAAITKNHGPYAANRTLALLRKTFYHGIHQLELNLKNPAASVTMNPETSRDRFLKKHELEAFFNAIHDDQTPAQWQDYFMLALWTGARRNNLSSMQWQHLDLVNRRWRIPGEEFKNGEPFTVVLTAPALEILIRRKLQNDGKSPFVFPSSGKSGHVQEPRKAWERITRRAGLEDVRIHDLRRTLGSWQAASGASLQVIGKTLGHRNQATTAIYSRLDLEPVEAAMDTATAAMLEAMNGNKK